MIERNAEGDPIWIPDASRSPDSAPAREASETTSDYAFATRRVLMRLVETKDFHIGQLRDRCASLEHEIGEARKENERLTDALERIWNPSYGEDAADTLAGCMNTAYEALNSSVVPPT